MYHTKASDICSLRFSKKRNAAALIPILIAFIYGAMVFQVTTVTTIFLSKMSAWESLLTIGVALSTFAAVCLWPVLIRIGNCATISELRMQLTDSEDSIRVMQKTETRLNSEIEDFEKELSRSYRYFRSVLKTFNMATFCSDMNHRIEWAHNFSSKNEEIVGRKITNIFPGTAGASIAQLMQSAICDGEIHEGEVEIMVQQEVRHYALQVAPRYDRQGKIIGTLCVSNDVTEKSKWHQHLASMTLEVNHRARNLLAIVVSLLGQTAKSASSVSEYKSKILTRVSSLAKSIDLITQDSWTASSLRKLVEIQANHVSAGKESQIRMSGEDLRLKSKAIQNVGLAIHELSTNSEKFGALSTGEGRVDVSWSTVKEDGQAYICLLWVESVPRKNSGQLQKGFGIRILEQIVAQELGGKSVWLRKQESVEFKMLVPIDWLEVHVEI